MKNTSFSRRSFLKATAAAVLAVSVSGMLAGCDGTADNGNQIASATYTLGEFDVTVTGNMGVDSKEDFGQNNISYIYMPKVKVKYNGKGGVVVAFKDVFSAKVGDKELKLQNDGTYIKSADIPFGSTSTYQPEFAVPVDIHSLVKQGTPFKLYVTLQGNSAEFSLTSDGKVTVAPVQEKQ